MKLMGTSINPLSLRERVRVRESNKDNLLILISPHPGLLPGGEGIIN
jgi:hypothetical protein